MGTMVNSLPLNSGFGSSNLPLPTKCPDGGIGIHEGLKIPWTLSPCKFDPCSGYLDALTILLWVRFLFNLDSLYNFHIS